MKIGFIDFSREERNKILATLSRLGEKRATDELGIGTIRDAYADILFPGISTLQTRAKYFVLIPYLFYFASNKKLNSGREILKLIQDKEDKIVNILIENSSHRNGIIGSTAIKKEKAVKNKPSSIYWNGLRTFGIVRNPKLSLLTASNIVYTNSKNNIKEYILKGDESFDDSTVENDGNVIFSPIKCECDINEISIELTHKEAVYLKDKICTASLSKNSLLASIINKNIKVEDFFDIPTDILNKEIAEQYLYAKSFSNFIYGAHIRYNYIYSEYKDTNMEKKFDEWKENFLKEEFELEKKFQNKTVKGRAYTFCEEFLKTVKEDRLKDMDNLIIEREREVKGSRAKLNKSSEYKYDTKKPIHDYKLDFRFGTAKGIIEDIRKGLEKENV